MLCGDKMRLLLIITAICFIAAPALGESKATLSPAMLKLLQQHNQKVKWEKLIGIGDVNCDGTKDYIVKGISGTRLYIAVVLGPIEHDSKVTSVNIGLGSQKYQDSLFERNPSIHIVTLDYDPKEISGFAAEGFMRSKQCKGIEVGGEESDEINIYWNHKKHKLDWWRL
jgi:hypothetical protein